MAGRTGRVMSERCKASLISWYPPPQPRNDKWKVWLKSLRNTYRCGKKASSKFGGITPKVLPSLKHWYKENRGGILETLLRKGSGSQQCPTTTYAASLLRASTTDFQMLRPLALEYNLERCKHLKFGLPFAPPFPAIPSLVNGQEWCLPLLF